MATVLLAPEAQRQFLELPRTIQIRTHAILIELQQWPNVSGCKPLRGTLAGNYRKRTGDYRIIFTVKGAGAAAVVTVWRIGHRDAFYE